MKKNKYQLLIFPMAQLDNNYIAFYRVRDNEIQVVRVLYGMCNYEDFL